MDGIEEDRAQELALRGRGKRGGRGGKGRGGGGGGQDREVLISKALSKLLRHAAHEAGIQLDDEGFAPLDKVMQWPRLRSLNPTLSEIRQSVADNAKQRFTLKPSPGAEVGEDDPRHWLIRANQGHSIELASEALHTPITLAAANVPDVVVHGTYFAFWPAIEEAGELRRMGRQHVHFGTGIPDEQSSASSAQVHDEEEEKGKGKGKVISGMRADAEILVFVDLRRCLADAESGLTWWLSENGVVLTEGPVPLRYVAEVRGRCQGVGVLWKDGVKVGDLPKGVVARVPTSKSMVHNMILFFLFLTSKTLAATSTEDTETDTGCFGWIDPHVVYSTIVYELIYRDVTTSPDYTVVCDVTTTLNITDTSTFVGSGGSDTSETITLTLTRSTDVPGGTVTLYVSSFRSDTTSAPDNGGTPSTGLLQDTSSPLFSSTSAELSSTIFSLSPSSQTMVSTVLPSSLSGSLVGMESSQSTRTQSEFAATSNTSASQSIAISTTNTGTTATQSTRSSDTTTISSSSILGFVTTIYIPGIRLSTMSLASGKTTILPLPAGLLTTLSGPATASKTVIPLPSGQQTTVTFNLSGGTIITLPGGAITTLSVSGSSLGTHRSSSSSITSSMTPPPGAEIISSSPATSTDPSIFTSLAGPTHVSMSTNPLTSTDSSTSIDSSTVNSLVTSPGSSLSSSKTSAISPSESSVQSPGPSSDSPSTSLAIGTLSGDITASNTNMASISPSSTSGRMTTSNTTVQASSTQPLVESSTVVTSDTSSQTPIPASSLKPVPTTRVFFDNTSYLVPPCEAAPLPVLLSDGSQEGFIYCDQVIIHGHVFLKPQDVSNSPETTENGWTVRWAPCGMRNDLSPESIRSSFINMINAAGLVTSGDGSAIPGAASLSDGYGGLFGLFGKLGGDILNIGYDAAAGLVDMGGAYEMQAMNDIQSTAHQVKEMFGNLGEDVANAIESLRASSPNIMPRDLETINQLGSGITQAENHWQQFLNLADISGATAAGRALFQLAKTKPVLPIVAPMAAGIWGLHLAIRHKSRLSNLLKPAWPADTPEDKRPEQTDSAFYYINCKRGTTIMQYNALKGLIGPVNQGYDMGINSWSPKIAPAYYASLNLTNAEMIKHIPIVNYILNHNDAHSDKETPILGGNTGHSILEDHDLHLLKSSHSPNKPGKRDLRNDPFAPLYLKILSAPKRTVPSTQPYLADDSSGKGSWIFILDAGFNIQNVQHELNSGEAHPARREIRTFVIPNDFTLSKSDGNQVSIGVEHAPENMDDVAFDPELIPGITTITQGHGTAVACIAGGSLTGVARNANLYLIKWKNMLTQYGKYIEERLKVPALKKGFDKILDAVLHEDISAPRSVVLITVAGDFRQMPSFGSEKYDEFIGDYLARFEELGITVVIPAGNYGIDSSTGEVGAYIGDLWPQKFGRADNSLITVGATNSRGSLFANTSPEGNSGQGANLPRGSMTVYAMGKGVMTYNAHGDPAARAGTSFAAPAVAGLVAYYLTLYSDTDMFTWDPNDENTGDSVGMRMKNYLVKKSFSRVEGSLRVDQGDVFPPYTIPDYINVAYNMARGDQCLPGDTTPGNNNYCSTSSSTSSSLTSSTSSSPGAMNANHARASLTSSISSDSESLARSPILSKTRDATILRRQWSLRSQRSRLPPGPPSLKPGLRKPWLWFRSLSSQYGDVAYLQIGPTPTVILGSARAAWELLERRGAVHSSRPRFIVGGELLSGGMRGLMAPYGDAWRRWRRLLHGGFTARRSAEYRPVQARESAVLMRDLLRDPDAFRTHLERYAASVIVTVTYGRRVEDVRTDEVVRRNGEAMERLTLVNIPGKYAVERYPALKYVPSIFAPWKREVLRQRQKDIELYTELMDEVRARRVRGTLPDCFAGHLLDEQASLGMSDLEIAYAAGSPFGAGVETSAGSLASFFLACAKFGHTFAPRAREELDRVVGADRLPTFSDLASLPYTRAIAAETLRWRPIAVLGGTPHASTADDTYRGMFIPKGSTIIAPLWSIHLNEDDFPDPHTFLPERFLQPRDYPGTLGHSAFGWGRRVCPGQHLATASVELNVARVLWAFDVGAARDGAGKEIDVDIFAFSDGFNSSPLPFPCSIVPRSAAHAEIVERECRDALVQLRAYSALEKESS
ncbi:hypothetical protein F4810DRAFT_707700 [Camillea tinctor]|nr:hypothetical protein F4810DRAFT_707700 [Camillea tinctor]